VQWRKALQQVSPTSLRKAIACLGKKRSLCRLRKKKIILCGRFYRRLTQIARWHDHTIGLQNMFCQIFAQAHAINPFVEQFKRKFVFIGWQEIFMVMKQCRRYTICLGGEQFGQCGYAPTLQVGFVQRWQARRV